jgi:hypothetical protein
VARSPAARQLRKKFDASGSMSAGTTQQPSRGMAGFAPSKWRSRPVMPRRFSNGCGAGFRLMNTYVLATRRITAREPHHYARWTHDGRLCPARVDDDFFVWEGLFAVTADGRRPTFGSLRFDRPKSGPKARRPGGG